MGWGWGGATGTSLASSESMKTYRTILVATDFSGRADAALEAGLELARREPRSKLVLAHVLDTSLGSAALPYDLTGESALLREGEAMDAARAHLRETATSIQDVDVEVMVRRGHPAKELARAATATGADLVVIATQGLGAVKRAILGSVTTSLLGYTSVPVLVVGERRPIGRLEKVLAAVDLSPVSPHVLSQALAMAELSEGGVRVASVFDEPLFIPGDHPFSLQAYALPARIRRLDEQREAVRKLVDAVNTNEVPCELSVVPGSPPHLEVLDLASKTEPDLIVVGASGHRTWSKALFGTNAARIIAGVPHVPVLVVPDPTHRASESGDVLGDKPSKDEPEEQVVYGTFVPGDLRRALEGLVDASIDADHISVVMSEETHADTFSEEDKSDEGFIAGGAVGTTVGGILGGLASLAVSSGIGLVVVGPAVALGLIGGLIGTLVGYGVPEHDAARLHDAVERGRVLVAVHAHDAAELERAKTALADAGAQPKRLFL